MTYLLAQASAHRIPLRAESVQTCVTSPPYWGLRAYAGEQRFEWGGEEGHAHEFVGYERQDERYTGRKRWQHIGTEAQAMGMKVRDLDPNAWGHPTTSQESFCACGAWYGALGLEPTPALYVEHMVEVFREVRRVLRKDGTLWLNLGDSYATGAGSVGERPGGGVQGDRWAGRGEHTAANSGKAGPRIAATGPMTQPNRMPLPDLKPKDLVGIPWMVARALQAPYYAGKIKNEADRVWLAAMIDGEGCMFLHKRKVGQSNGQGYARKHDTYGAGLEISNTSEAIIQRVMQITRMGSVFRHEKSRRQPLFRWNLRSNQCRDIIREVYPYLIGKQHQARLLLGCPSSGEPAEKAHSSLIALHNGETPTIDFAPPESLYEPGWYLRSDIVWSKLNPMPESVTDRPTKSHDYVFLLTKSERYYYDAGAIRDAVQQSSIDRVAQNGGNPTFDGARARRENGHISGRDTLRPDQLVPAGGRNARSVWTIATQPYPGAHFATFPEELPKRCIKAGSAAQACGVCGAPWARVTERTDEPDASARGSTFDGGKTGARDGGDRTQAGPRFAKRVTGFRPTCAHDDGSASSVILDLFNGSGTTGAVALRLGRAYVGLDLSREYLSEQALRRIDPIAASAADFRNGVDGAQGVMAL